jgi:hypothetical protein
MASKGGYREGSGRKPKADEEKANALFLRALKTIYGKYNDDDAKEAFIISLEATPRGKMFIAEHLFGKTVSATDLNVLGERSYNMINLGSGVNPEKPFRVRDLIRFDDE